MIVAIRVRPGRAPVRIPRVSGRYSLDGLAGELAARGVSASGEIARAEVERVTSPNEKRATGADRLPSVVAEVGASTREDVALQIRGATGCPRGLRRSDRETPVSAPLCPTPPSH